MSDVQTTDPTAPEPDTPADAAGAGAESELHPPPDRRRRPRAAASTTPSPPPSSRSTTAQIVDGTVVKVDKDEVLLDIGYKSEGVIPARELSIRNDVDPTEIVVARRRDRGPRPPEGGQGRPPGPVQEAGPVRAGLGRHRADQGRGRRRLRPGHRGRQGRPDPRHRPARLPARLARRAAPGARPPALRRPHARGQDHRARQEPQQRRAVPPGVAGGDAEGAARGVPRQPQAGRGPQGHRVVGRQLRRLRRPRRHGRPRPRVRAVVEARRPPRLGRGRRRRDRGAGARGRPRPRAHQPLAQGHPAGPVAGVRHQPPGRRAGLRPGHQAGAVRRVRPGGRRHRGPGPHLRDVGPPRRPARAGGHPRRGAVGQDHRPRPPAPPHQPVDQAGGRGRRRGRRVPGALRRARLRRRGQLHRRRRRALARGRGGLGRVLRRVGRGTGGRRRRGRPAGRAPPAAERCAAAELRRGRGRRGRRHGRARGRRARGRRRPTSSSPPSHDDSCGAGASAPASSRHGQAS